MKMTKYGIWLVFFISVSTWAMPTTALTFKYFAYGSNCYPATMTALRNIECIDSSAGILGGCKLRFNIPGMPLVEPSWACVEASRDESNCVHGVLYTLTPQDFARVSMSEGVPFGYQWRVVNVVPYQGDGIQAGETALREQRTTSGESVVKAYTLVSNNPLLIRDIPPSKAYRDLLIRGAKAFQMDQSYIDKLEAIRPGFTIGEGFVAKDVLEAAERRKAGSK